MVQDLQATVLRLSSNIDMRKPVDISKYFPVKQDADLQSFLDKSDGQFDCRRVQFENFLYCNVTKSMKLKRTFEATLLSTLFSRDFISSHRWPGPRYGIIFSYNIYIYVYIYINFIYIYCSLDPADFDIVVPDEFAILLKVALSKMVAAKCLNPEFVNLDFWRKMPIKFKGIRYYEDKKTKTREVTSAR